MGRDGFSTRGWNRAEIRNTVSLARGSSVEEIRSSAIGSPGWQGGGGEMDEMLGNAIRHTRDRWPGGVELRNHCSPSPERIDFPLVNVTLETFKHRHFYKHPFHFVG